MAKIKTQSIFEDDGYLINSKHYSIRDSQISMANVVEDCLYNNKYAVLEAGTGTGKSYAYLIPSMLYSEEKGEDVRVVISTATLNLQDQIFKKDIPYLQSLLNTNLQIVYFSGKQNYLCIRGIKELISKNAVNDDLLDNLNETINRPGIPLISELPYSIPYSVIKDINCSIEDCTKGKCQYFNDCHYYRSKKEAFASNILIVNHKLLLNDAKLRFDSKEEQLVLPRFNNLVIDEAHTLESTCQDSFKQEVSMWYLINQMSLLNNATVNRRVDFFNILSKSVGKDQIKIFRESCDKIIKTALLIKELEGNNEHLIDDANINKFENILNSLSIIGKEVDSIMKILLNSLAYLQEKADDDMRNFLRYQNQVNRVSIFDKYIKDFLNFNDKNLVKSIKINSDDTIFISIPLKVDKLLQETIYEQCDTAIFTSATLNLGDNFKYYINSIGLDKVLSTVTTSSYESPFDYKNNLMILSTSNTPMYTKQTAQEYPLQIAAEIQTIVKSSEGNALILFTSYMMMENVYDIVNQNIGDSFNLLKQSRDISRFELLNKFKKEDKSVLFATSSFWQGIDVPGDSLQIVVIVKLPFAVPTTPLALAQSKQMEKEGKSYFIESTMPDAIMKLKQGVGRLIRRETDRGIVVILDSRIVKKNYGPHMLGSLVDCNKVVTEKENLSEQIERFLY